jgi:hypothetical protein
MRDLKPKWPWRSKPMVVATRSEDGDALRTEYRVPSAIGELADHWYDVNQRRKALNREAEALEAEERAIKAWAIAELPKTELARGVVGSVAMFLITPGEVFTIADAAKLTRYVVRHGATDVFQRRLNAEAIAARVEADGERVLAAMGVERFAVLKASVKAAPKAGR